MSVLLITRLLIPVTAFGLFVAVVLAGGPSGAPVLTATTGAAVVMQTSSDIDWP